MLNHIGNRRRFKNKNARKAKHGPVAEAGSLVVEVLEPRLLLSVSGLGTVKAAHDNLANLATVVSGLDHLGPMTTPIQLVEIGGHSTVGDVFSLSTIFTQEVVAPLDGISKLPSSEVPTFSFQLGAKLSDAITSVIGSGAGKGVSVLDQSPDLLSGDTKLHIVIDDQQSFGFSLNLGDAGDTYGIKFADSVGQATVNYHFDLTFTVSGLSGTENPTASQSQSGFTLQGGSFTASFSANTNLAGQEFNFGILKLSVPTTAAVNLSESLAIGGSWSATSGTDLATKATAVSGGDYGSLKGGSPFVTNSITSQTNGPTLLDLPVNLLDTHTIEGITSFTGGHIVIGGHASGTDLSVNLDTVFEKLKTATDNPDLDPVGFNNFLVKDLIGKIGSLNTYIGNLASKSASLDLSLPFLQDTSIGTLLDTAAAFKSQFIDPLASPAHEFGFNEGVSSASGQTTLGGGVITDDALSALPADLAMRITLDNGLTATLAFESKGIATGAGLADAVNDAIKGTAIDGFISASSAAVAATLLSPAGTQIVLSIIGSHGDQQPKRISVSSPDMASDIRGVGIAVARLLHLPGWDDTTATPQEYGDTLLGELGLAYDKDHNGITLTISKEITLPEVVVPFAVDFSLGDLAGLSLTNAQFHLSSSVLLSLTVGYSLDPIGADVNKPGGPQIGDGNNGTTDTAVQDLPVYIKATAPTTDGSGASVDQPITADQIINDGGSHPDLQIIGREGLVKTFEITPDETLSNLETQISNSFKKHMTLSLDPDTGVLTLTDTFDHPYDGPTPAALGFKVGSLAEAVQDATNTAKYTATLNGIAPSNANYANESEFILSVGTLTPVVVDVGSGSNTASSYVSRLNAELATISVDPKALGLDASKTVTYGDIVTAALDSNGGVKLTTKIYDAIKQKLGEDPYLSSQRVAIQSGLKVDNIQLMASAMNGSLLPSLLGLVGSDAAGESTDTSVIKGLPLHTETQADRFYLQNSGISAIVTAALEPEDDTQPVVLSGNFGAFGFTSTLYDPADVTDSAEEQLSTTYISFKVSLLLNTPGEDPGGHITIAELQDALTQGEFTKIWSLNLASGIEDAPFASIDIKNITLSLGSTVLTSAASPEVLVTADAIENLIDHKAPEVHVEVSGLSKTLVAADLIGALQQTFDSLNSDVMQTSLPLVNVSLDDILSFGQTFLQALDAAEQNPDGSIAQVQNAINGVLGADVLKLSIDNNHQLIAALHWTPVEVKKDLPFNLDLNALDALLGGSDSTLSAVASSLGAIASLSADGNVKVNAGVDLALTLGFDLNAEGSPALAATLLSAVNNGKGLRTDSAGKDDVKFTLGSGKTFTVNVGALGAKAKVSDLVKAINDAAGKSDFAAYDAKTGTLALTDSSAATVAGVTDLGYTDGQVAGDYGKVNKLVGKVLTSSDYAKAYSFTLNIGSNVHADVELAADAARTTASDLVTALREALATTMVSGKALIAEHAKPPGTPSDPDADFDVAMGQLVQVLVDKSDHLVMQAIDGVLGTDKANNLLNTFSISAGTPKLTFKVESLNGSTIVQDIGFGEAGTASVTDEGTRTLTAKLMQSDTFGNRLYIETGKDPKTNQILTGVEAHLGIVASDLNFSVALGPFSASITNGVAVLGEDVGHAKAGSKNFKVGDAATHPAYFDIGLNDGFGGGSNSDGRVTFADLSHLGEAGNKLSDLIHVTANAAVSVDLPAKILGGSVGDVKFDIGNLFDTKLVVGELPRSSNFSFPDFSKISISSFLNDPETLIKGLDAFLGALSGPFAQSLYNLDVPLIGPALHGLGDFFGIMHTDVVERLEALLEGYKSSHPGLPISTQSLVTQGLVEALDLLGVPGDVYSYLDSPSKPTELGFVWAFDIALLHTSVNLTSDLGIPGLGLKIDNGQAAIDVTLHVTLGFGYKKDQGFFVYDMGGTSAIASFVSNDDPGHVFKADFRTTHALDLAVAVSLASNFSATLNLGFLTMVAENGSMLTAKSGNTTITGTSITGDIYLDVGPKDTDGRLLFSEFSKGPIIRAGTALQVNVDLMLTAGIGFGSFPIGFPTVTTELTFEYYLGKTFFGAVGNEAASGVVIPVTFNHVSLDIGSFLSSVLLPVLDEIETVIGPLQPIIDFLKTPIPGLSVILGPTSIIDLAQRFAPSPAVQNAVKFLELVDTLNQIDHDLHRDGSGANKIDFGTYVFGALSSEQASIGSGSGFGGFGGFHSLSSVSFDPFGGKLPSFDFSAASASLGASSKSKSDAGDAVSKSGGKSGGGLRSLMSSGIITFPVLQDPLSLLKMLMGVDVTLNLIEVHLPQFSFSFGKDIKFNFFVGPVPIQVDIYAAAGATFNLAFGYDTTGIKEFVQDKNPLDLFDGFYIDNTIGPQMIFWAKFGLTGAVNLVLVKAGIGGEIRGEVDFTLYDPNHDGKVRFSEFLYELTHEPLHMFVIDGSIGLRIYAFAWVGIDFFFGEITIFEASFDIINVTLLSFHYDYHAAHSTPHLASMDDSGKLTLNLGANADQQEVGNNIGNPSQNYTITHVGGSAGNETLQITANGATQIYTGVHEVVANLGEGNNTVKFDGGIGSNVTLVAGDGNNVLDLGGVIGDPQIIVGNGNNYIVTSASGDTVVAGDGRNTIKGGQGPDSITVGSGDNLVIGGGGNDTIIATGGNNTVYGGGGDDSITVGSGNNTIYGGGGSNTIAIVNGAGNNVIFGHGPDDDSQSGGVTLTSTIIEADPAGAVTGNNTIKGGGGNDTIFGGGGNSSITGGTGQDVIFGSYGQVSLDGAGGIVSLSASQATGGDNIIQGGAGDEVILGGAGNNSILGGGGSDIILAGTGTVDGAKAAGGPDAFTITSSSVGTGTNIVDGGGGNDVILGTTGRDMLTGSDGNDIILGDLGTIVRDGPVGSAHLISIQTSDEALGAADTIQGSAGSDIVFGGKGADSIDVATGTDIALGDFGKLTATDAGTVLTILGQDAGTGDNGNDTITASGSAIIMGGGGDNVITTTEALSPADMQNSIPAVTPKDRTEVVFGAAGLVTADYAPLGGYILHQAGNVEEANGGNNTITVGDGNDAIFGGPGADTIRSGSGDLTYGIGNTVTLAHFGDITWTDNNRSLVVASRDGDPGAFRHGNATVDGYSNSVIIGGSGDNTLTTHDSLSVEHGVNDWTEVVFGGNGNANLTYDANGRIILLQGYTHPGEENFGGNNTIRVGDANDVVVGGAGIQHITAGNGDNILLGHLGTIDLTRPASPDTSGFTPDILSFTAPQDLSTQPTPSAFITSGNGNSVIMGGSGDNTILAGIGNNVIFGASGAVTRDADGVLLKAFTVEETLGGNELITAGLGGQGSNTVFGGAGTTTITVGDGNNVVLGHIGTFTRMDGISPDVIGRETTLYGGIQPPTPNPAQLLISMTTILAGNGNNVIQGSSAGNNIITAGIGNNIVFGAAGLVTRTAASGLPGAFTPVRAETVEECIAGDNLISVGRHGAGAGSQNVVFGGFGANTIFGGDGDNKVFGHSGFFGWYANGEPGLMLSRDFDCGLDVFISVGDGNNDVLGGKGSNRITGGDGHNVLMSDQGKVIWNTDGTRYYAESQRDPGPAGNSTVKGGNGNNDIIGGPDRDLLIGGDGTNIIIGYNGQIFFDHGVEIRAQTVEPFTGGRHTLVGGKGHDFMIGGTRGNDFEADPLNDLIYTEQGKFDLENRIAKWEQPPFFINSVTNPVFNWFNTLAYYDALAGETHTTMNGDPLLVQYASHGYPVLFTQDPTPPLELQGLHMAITFGPGAVPGSSPLFNGLPWLVSAEAGGRVVVVTGIGLSAGNTVLTPMWDWLPGDAGAGPAMGAPTLVQTSAQDVPTPVYLVEGDQTLPGGRDLAALAATVSARRHGAPQAWVLDEATGRWVLDVVPDDGPRLVLDQPPELLPEDSATIRSAVA